MPEEIEKFYNEALQNIKDHDYAEAKKNFIKYIDIIEKKFKGKKVYSPANGLEAHLISEDKDTTFTNYHVSDAYFYIGNILFEEDKLAEARKYLNHAIKWNPYDCRARFEEAESFKVAGNIVKYHELNEQAYDYLYHPEEYARYLRNLGYYYIEEKEYRLAQCIYLYSIQYDESKGTEIWNELDYISNISDYKELPNKNEVIEILHKNNINVFIPQKNILKIYDLYDEIKEDNELKKLLKQLKDFYSEFLEIERD